MDDAGVALLAAAVVHSAAAVLDLSIVRPRPQPEQPTADARQSMQRRRRWRYYRQIRRLDLYGNPITDEGACALLRAATIDIDSTVSTTRVVRQVASSTSLSVSLLRSHSVLIVFTCIIMDDMRLTCSLLLRYRYSHHTGPFEDHRSCRNRA